MREKSKNTMRSAEEKERIVLESFKEGRNKTANKYDIHVRVLTKWLGDIKNSVSMDCVVKQERHLMGTIILRD